MAQRVIQRHMRTAQEDSEVTRLLHEYDHALVEAERAADKLAALGVDVELLRRAEAPKEDQ